MAAPLAVYTKEEQEFLSRWNMGPSLWARIQKAEYAVETPMIANEEEIQDSIFCGKVDVNFFLGLKMAYTTWKRGVRSKVQATVICWPTIWSQ
jgi:hypothetical protein